MYAELQQIQAVEVVDKKPYDNKIENKFNSAGSYEEGYDILQVESQSVRRGW